MIGILAAAALISAQPAPPIGKTAWVFSSVNNSEWCPAGHVRLDLVTGKFHLTPGADRRVCQNQDLERREIGGKLTGPALAAARMAYVRAVDDGLESAACREGRPPDDVFISNGGAAILLVGSGRATFTLPAKNRGCWSPAANALYKLMGDMFNGYGR